MAPKRVGHLDGTICKVLVNGLATQFCVRPNVARKFLLEVVEQWGKLRRLKGGDIMHVDNIAPKHMDGWDASFVCVHELRTCVFRNYLNLFPNSMSNLLIETSTINTILKSLNFKHSLGNFSTLSSSPFPKVRSLKQRRLKTFVLWLFGKFMLFSPTIIRYCQFHFTYKMGPWTLLTSNPSNALLAVLGTRGNRDWLTAVARWLMQYFQRWISWR